MCSCNLRAWLAAKAYGEKYCTLKSLQENDHLGKRMGGSKLATRMPRSMSLSSNFLRKGWFWKQWSKSSSQHLHIGAR